MKDLDVAKRDDMDSIFRDARADLNGGKINEAIRKARLAWTLLPEPKFDWDVSKSYTHSLARMFRDARMYSDALAVMQDLFESKTVLPYQDQPRFIMGTIYYEMGDMENAQKWLSEAKNISKGRCFVDEHEKYAKLLEK